MGLSKPLGLLFYTDFNTNFNTEKKSIINENKTWKDDFIEKNRKLIEKYPDAKGKHIVIKTSEDNNYEIIEIPKFEDELFMMKKLISWDHQEIKESVLNMNVGDYYILDI